MLPFLSHPFLTSKKILIIINALAVLILLIVSTISLAQIKILKQEILNLKTFSQDQTNQLDQSTFSSEILKSGIVGEVKVEEENINNENLEKSVQLPPIVFNTTGTIAEIKDNGLIVSGDGSNFADKIARTLNIGFTSKTSTFISFDQKTEYQGLEGLNHLKTGTKILLEGNENIRGKTEFSARTINILQ